jgi:hypothetical protein
VGSGGWSQRWEIASGHEAAVTAGLQQVVIPTTVVDHAAVGQYP